MSEAVRAVQHPESDTPQTRAYYRMAASEAETLSAVRAAGGDNVFLFAGQRGEDEEDLHKVSSLVRSLDRKTLFEQPSQGDGDDLFPMPQPSGTELIPRPIGGLDFQGNLGDIQLPTHPLLTGDNLSFMSSAFGVVGFLAGGVALFVPAAVPIAVGSTRVSLGLAAAAGLAYAAEGENEEALEETIIPLAAIGATYAVHSAAIWAILLADQVYIPLQRSGDLLFSESASANLLEAYRLLFDALGIVVSSGTDAGDE